MIFRATFNHLTKIYMKTKLITNFLLPVFAWSGAVAVWDVTHLAALPLDPKITAIIAVIPVTAAAIYHSLKPIVEKLDPKEK